MRRAYGLAVAIILLVSVAFATRATWAQTAEESGAPEGGVQQRRSLEPSQDLTRQEQQIHRTRSVTRRILHDRRASEEIKQQATELDALLDKRQQAIDRLQSKQREFVTQHRTDIEELEDLQRRAHELDDRLSTARKDVLDGSKDDVAMLKDASSRAAELADGLRTRYQQERRGGRRPH